jgi:hypothetical protein
MCRIGINALLLNSFRIALRSGCGIPPMPSLKSERRRAFGGGDGFQCPSRVEFPAITFMLLMVRIASLSMVPLIISGKAW